MSRTEGLMMGIILGLIVGVILVVILLKFANKDKKVKSEYDERQKEIKNKGYVVGFYSMVALLGIESLWSITGREFPLPDFAVFFATLIFGLTVMCGYAIWNGVYWGMNNDKKRYGIIFAIAIVLNIIPIVHGAASGNLLSRDPFESLALFNVIVVIMMAVILIELLIRWIVDKCAGEEE